jgi:hypothetical protein
MKPSLQNSGYYLDIFLEGLKETAKNLSGDQFSGPSSVPRISGVEAEALSSRPRRSTMFHHRHLLNTTFGY